MHSMASFGDRLKELRSKHHLTQAKLGRTLSPPVSANSVRSWEKDAHNPRADHLRQLVEALRTSADYLLGGSEAAEEARASRSYDPDEPPIPPGLQQLIETKVPMARSELVQLLGYADPLNAERGARGAANWSAGEWLDVLLAERRSQG